LIPSSHCCCFLASSSWRLASRSKTGSAHDRLVCSIIQEQEDFNGSTTVSKIGNNRNLCCRIPEKPPRWHQQFIPFSALEKACTLGSEKVLC
jgi:hypothetical protein